MNRVVRNRNGEPFTLEPTQAGEVRVSWNQGYERKSTYLSVVEARELARVLAEVAAEATKGYAQRDALVGRG